MMDIKEGATIEGSSPYIGLGLITLGLVFSAYSFSTGAIAQACAALVIVFAGVVVFLNIQGTMIDPVGRRLRPYRSYLLFRTGAWTDLGRYDRVTVTHLRESYSHLGTFITGTEPKIRTYFVLLRGRAREHRLKEVGSAKEALALAQTVATALGWRIEDLIPRPSWQGQHRH
jgi:hypothetical protein